MLYAESDMLFMSIGNVEELLVFWANRLQRHVNCTVRGCPYKTSVLVMLTWNVTRQPPRPLDPSDWFMVGEVVGESIGQVSLYFNFAGAITVCSAPAGVEDFQPGLLSH